jgi:nicotinate-nucleotide pyrophosphorylase (carboxylating)
MKTVQYINPQQEIPATLFEQFCISKLGMNSQKVSNQLQNWLEEDFSNGDVSLWASEWSKNQAEAFIVAKQDFILCGLPLMVHIFSLASGSLSTSFFSDFEDGNQIKKGQTILKIVGTAGALLLAERSSLNLASHLSGIATQTHNVKQKMFEIAKNHNLKLLPELLETRKTTPGLRSLEKYATRTGGAKNHRHALDTGAMLKENHLRMSESISYAIETLVKNAPILTKIEVEVSNLVEFEEALKSNKADVIMLDNFKADEVKITIQQRNLFNSNIKIELSGNLDEKNLEEILMLEVDYMSMGALIHKSKWVDMSLQLFPV